jgi:taurine dioxygenase
MPGEALTVEKLTPHIGAEVHGVDLGRPLDEPTFKQIHDALIESSVIFFRDQHLSPESQKAFGRLFGELAVHPAAPGLVEGHPEILVIHADESSKHVAGEDWHSDVSCDPEPPMGSVLYMKELPAVGGDTLFASMYAAYEALSEPMKRLLEGMTALHRGEHVYRGRYGVNDAGKVFPEAEHPIMSRLESEGVLGMLYRHIETPEFHCRFRWRVNSVAFWDNRCAQHHALWDYYPQRRHGHRVTIKGDRPFYRG